MACNRSPAKSALPPIALTQAAIALSVSAVGGRSGRLRPRIEEPANCTFEFGSAARRASTPLEVTRL